MENQDNDNARHPVDIIIMRNSCRTGNLTKILELVDGGFDMQPEIYSYLKAAADGGQLEVVQFLAERGASIRTDNGTALISAANKGHLNVVQYLVANFSNFRAHDSTALVEAARYGHADVLAFLIFVGGNIFAQYEDALNLAVRNAHEAIIQLLLDSSISQNRYFTQITDFVKVSEKYNTPVITEMLKKYYMQIPIAIRYSGNIGAWCVVS